METLVRFNIPILGLGSGIHQFNFEVDQHFFQHFEASTIKDGKIAVQVTFDKRPDLYVLTFDITGTIKTICDRCLEEFNLPINDIQNLLVKFDEKEHEDAEVIYIVKGTPKLNVAKYIYEFIHLAIPMIKTHDEAEEACNEEMLAYLDRKVEEEEKKEEVENPVWAALKNLKKD